MLLHLMSIPLTRPYGHVLQVDGQKDHGGESGNALVSIFTNLYCFFIGQSTLVCRKFHEPFFVASDSIWSEGYLMRFGFRCLGYGSFLPLLGRLWGTGNAGLDSSFAFPYDRRVEQPARNIKREKGVILKEVWNFSRLKL